MEVWLAGVFWDRYGATSISAQAERTDSTPNGGEFGVTVGMAGGEGQRLRRGTRRKRWGARGGRVGELDRSWGGLGWEGVGRGGVRGQGQGLMQGRGWSTGPCR